MQDTNNSLPTPIQTSAPVAHKSVFDNFIVQWMAVTTFLCTLWVALTAFPFVMGYM
jgi:hypothetical protein